MGASGTSLRIAASELESTRTSVFRVTACDGFRTASDVSDAPFEAPPSTAPSWRTCPTPQNWPGSRPALQAAPSEETASRAVDDDDDTGGSTTLAVVGVGLALVLLAVAVVLVRRRKRSTPDTP